MNILAFTIFQFMSFIVMNMSWITVWLAVLANINVGIITVIWSLTPFLVAVIEYVFFR